MTHVSLSGDEKADVRKGPWTAEEDELLVKCIAEHGDGNWSSLPRKAGLQRCGKSCRLRWTNYLRPDLKRGAFSRGEEELVVRLHRELGNRWAKIALELPGRTDNDIKNHWNTRLKRKLRDIGVDPDTHLLLRGPALPLPGPSGLLDAALGDHPRGVNAGAAADALAEPPVAVLATQRTTTGPTSEGSPAKRRRVFDCESTRDASCATPTNSASRIIPSHHAPAAPLPRPRAAPQGTLLSPCSLPPSAATTPLLEAPAAGRPRTSLSADATPSTSSASPCDSPSAQSPASQPSVAHPDPPALAFSALSARVAAEGLAEAEAKWRCLRPSRAWRLGPGAGLLGFSRDVRMAEREATGLAGLAGLTGLSGLAGIAGLAIPGTAGRVRAGYKVPPRLVIPSLSGEAAEVDGTAAAAESGAPVHLSAGQGRAEGGSEEDTKRGSVNAVPSPLVLFNSLWESADPSNLWSTDSSLDDSPLWLPSPKLIPFTPSAILTTKLTPSSQAMANNARALGARAAIGELTAFDTAPQPLGNCHMAVLDRCHLGRRQLGDDLMAEAPDMRAPAMASLGLVTNIDSLQGAVAGSSLFDAYHLGNSEGVAPSPRGGGFSATLVSSLPSFHRIASVGTLYNKLK